MPGFDEMTRQAAQATEIAWQRVGEVRSATDYPWLRDRLDRIGNDLASIVDELRSFRSAEPPICLSCGQPDYGPICPSCDPGFAQGADDETTAELSADMQLAELPILGWMSTDEGEADRRFAIVINEAG
jgi:hypothetical protein